jgi:hypothetical protein
MQPFNISQALAGKPFTNDKGWTVEDWHYFKDAKYPIVIKWKEYDFAMSYNEEGLFMPPEKKKVWIVVYRSISHNEPQGKFCFTKQYRDDFIKSLHNRYLETIEKEY